MNFSELQGEAMALTFEQIAEVAQKYVSTFPVIVLGTGASIPHGLPSMSDLAELLVCQIPEPQESIDKARWEAFKNELMKLDDLDCLDLLDLSMDHRKYNRCPATAMQSCSKLSIGRIVKCLPMRRI
jgi:hypothetical protein